ncbi:hypothetical protein SASPL_124838 [Salvia splendens]|uniref:Uncharacterized protein n=1 Tax=Salvia splendens TaxID=180675 RepID=A0A8X8ZPH5_SALSN|nr:hypothetical protein SASPL_124838 [Salvia splendens]
MFTYGYTFPFTAFINCKPTHSTFLQPLPWTNLVIVVNGVSVDRGRRPINMLAEVSTCATSLKISMADDDSYGAYHRLPSFIKVFYGARNKEEMRLPPQWVAEHGDDLPFDCRLRGNNISHGDKLSFTLVDVGIFHVKRYKSGTGCTPRGDLETFTNEEDEEIYTPDIDSSDDYAPSDVELESADDSDYDDDRGALDDDEYPTWTLKLTKSNIKRIIEIPNDFW